MLNPSRTALGTRMAALVLAAATFSSPSRAGDVDVDVGINNGITILYYSSLSMTIDASPLGAIIVPGSCTGSNPYECLPGRCDRRDRLGHRHEPASRFRQRADTARLGRAEPRRHAAGPAERLGGTSANTQVSAHGGTNTMLSTGVAAITLNSASV